MDKDLKKLYCSWVGIRRRANGKCFDENDRHKHIYANITVDKDWEKWENYKDWALSNGWKPGLTIDRIDNDKGYSPENCRWVTIAENNRNKKNVKKYLYCGELLTLGQIAERNNVDRACFCNRVRNLGWSIEKALKYKTGDCDWKEKNRVRNQNMKKDYDSGMSVKEISKKYKIGERHVYTCLKPII